MEEPSFRKCARDCYEGRITLAQFFRLTRMGITRMAASLLKRWRAPPNVALEDMAQEIRVGCIWAFKKYDPHRPGAADIGDYIFWNSCDKAKKWLHKQRGVILHGNPDGRKSRYALLFVDIAERRSKSAESPVEIENVVEALRDQPVQETALVRRETWKILVDNAPTVYLRWALLALEVARGERQAAAKALYSNVDVRLRLHLSSERDARKAVAAAIQYLKVA